MIDKEKVIKGLEKLRTDLGYGLLDRSNVVMEYLNSITGALDLLKERAAVPVIQREVMNMLVWCCGSCLRDRANGDKFCRICGKEGKWDA